MARRNKTQRTAEDDAVMALVVQELRANPDARPTPEYWRAMLERFLELLEQESAQRPAHRPRGSNAGALVEILIQAGMSQPAARQRIARLQSKSRDAVARDHTRYRHERDKNSR